MGHYNMVKPGDPFRPSAGLENEVRRFFNGGATISGSKISAGSVNNSRISATNRTSSEIPVFRPVAIFYDATKDCFHIKPATASDDLFGITTEIIPPNSSGTVVLSGVVNAVIFGGTGNFATPGSDGKLTRSSSGRAQILYEGTTDKPGIVLLGGGSGGEEEYTGQFAVRHLENRTFEITYPRQQPLEYAGRTDLPYVGEVPVQTVTLPANMDDGELRFYACFKENAYSAVIQFSELPPPEGWFDRFLLAHVYASGRVTQYYKSYTDYSFGSRWFL